MIKGVLAPVTTPFSESGELLIDAFHRNLQRYRQTPLKGILVAGTTGEGAHLSLKERILLAEAAVAEAVPEWTCMVGVGSASLRGVLEQLDGLSKFPLDGVLISLPHYYRTRMDEGALRRFFIEAADASPFPAYLYNIPQLTGIELPVSLVQELAGHSNIVGMKESSGNLIYLQSILQATSAKGFEVISGSAETFGLALAVGIHAGILAAACFAPALADQVYRAALSREADFGVLQARLFSVSSLVVRRLGVAGVKRAMDRTGFEGLHSRIPLRALDSAEAALVDNTLSTALTHEI